MERLESLVEWWIDFQLPVLEPLLFAAGYAALLAGLILVINVTCRRWFSAGQMGLLWGLVLVRLALPAAPALPLSLGSLWNSGTAAVERFVSPEESVFVPAMGGTHSPGDAIAVQDVAVAGLESRQVNEATASRPDAADPGDPLWVLILGGAAMLIVIAFPFVATGLLLRTAVVHWRHCRFVGRHSETRDERLRTLVADAIARAGTSRRISLYVLAEQQQPAICGVWSPAILLPVEAVELSDDRLRMLMLHELAHVRRGDVAVNWMLAVLKAAHWWNPVFWLAAARFGALREQACDAFAVARGGDGSSKEYGQMLLHFAAIGAPRSRWLVSIPAPFLGISPRLGRRGMRRRLESLRSATRRRGPVQKGMVATVAVALAVAGWSEAKERVSEPSPRPWMPPVSSVTNWSARPEENGDVVSIELDVADALKRHRETGLSDDVARKALTSLLDPASELPGCQIEGNMLKLTARQSTVDDITRQLGVWKDSGIGQIVVECRIISAQEDLATPVGIGWQSMGQTRPSSRLVRFGQSDQPLLVSGSAATEHAFPICVAAINDSQAFQIVRAAQGDRRSNVMFAPKITMFNGGMSRMTNFLHPPFVVGVEEESTGKLHPKVQTIEEGMALTLCPTQNREQSAMRITGHLELSDIVDVMTVGARTKSGRKVNVQVPRVNRVCIDVDSTVKKGESLLIGCLPSYERRGFLYLMVTARTPEEIEAKARTIRRSQQ